MGQDGEDGFTPRALDAPNSETPQADTDVMRMPRQAPAAVTGRLVFELEAEGEEERQHTFEKRLAVAKQLKVGRFVLKLNNHQLKLVG